ncbi:MAG: hypothetical protein AVDCRST_MAG07-544, partial [uncultured Frankineae bacterium]
ERPDGSRRHARRAGGTCAHGARPVDCTPHAPSGCRREGLSV